MDSIAAGFFDKFTPGAGGIFALLGFSYYVWTQMKPKIMQMDITQTQQFQATLLDRIAAQDKEIAALRAELSGVYAQMRQMAQSAGVMSVLTPQAAPKAVEKLMETLKQQEPKDG